jgi:predicted site-specific integrase-resolvase
MSDKQRDYLSSAELADRWRLSLQTLANWRHAGKGPPFVRVGSRILYPAQAVYSFEKLDAKWLEQ